MSSLKGMETFDDIGYYGTNKIDLLREFYPYQNGIPSEVTIGRLFSWVNPKCFTHILMAMVKTLSPNLHDKLIAIDGRHKTGDWTFKSER